MLNNTNSGLISCDNKNKTICKLLNIYIISRNPNVSGERSISLAQFFSFIICVRCEGISSVCTKFYIQKYLIKKFRNIENDYFTYVRRELTIFFSFYEKII